MQQLRDRERIYAWGDTWDCNKAVSAEGTCNTTSQTADVGSKSTAGDTPQGLADMSGNVWEWCSDNSQGSVTGGTDRYNFADDQTSAFFLHRGGAWNNATENIFTGSRRNSVNPNNRYFDIGFRVVRP